MSDFSQIIGCDKVGQQPLVQSVLKGSKKLKPQGSKRSRLRSLCYSTDIFPGVSMNKKIPVVCEVNCFSLDTVPFKIQWMMLEAFRMRSGKLKTWNAELPLQLGARALFQEAPSSLRGLATGRSLLWPTGSPSFPLAGQAWATQWADQGRGDGALR